MTEVSKPRDEDKRVVGYIRPAGVKSAAVSSLVLQREEITRWCCQQGGRLQGFYTEDCSGGGSLENRPELAKLLEDAGQGQFDIVAVTSLDRLVRNLQGLKQILEALSNPEVALVAVKEGITLIGPQGRLLATMMELLYQHETACLRQRRGYHGQS